MNIEQLRKDAIKLATKNINTCAVIAQLYVSNTINPYFICTGYDEVECLENALELNILQRYSSVEELAQDITIIDFITNL